MNAAVSAPHAPWMPLWNRARALGRPSPRASVMRHTMRAPHHSTPQHHPYVIHPQSHTDRDSRKQGAGRMFFGGDPFEHFAGGMPGGGMGGRGPRSVSGSVGV